MRLHLIWLVTVLPACTHLGPRGAPNSRPPEVRDVPFAARGDDESPRTRVAILPFLEERPNGELGELARPAVTRELTRGGSVVVSDDDLPADVKRQLLPGNEYDLSAVAQKLAPLGIGAVIEGKVLEVRVRKLGDTLGLIREAKAQVTARVRVRVFGGKAGKEIFSGERSAEVESSATFVAETLGGASLRDDPDLTRSAITRAFNLGMGDVTRAVEKLGWRGRVARIAGERVFINAGRLTGLQVGDLLKVSEEGDDIYDPDTGRFIGTAPGRLKGTVEVISYFGKDGAIALVHSGAGFSTNDHVEMY